VPARNHRDDAEWHECIVIGAGLLGLAAARSLSQRGRQVLVLDPDTPGHDRSGSKGTARIFRLGYPDPLYVRMAAQALARWRVLEEESGQSLLHLTGQATFGPEIGTIAAALSEVGAPFSELSTGETAVRFPSLHIGGPSLLEQSSGVLVADRCLQALQDTAAFDVRSGVGVHSLHDGKDEVTILLNDEDQLSADVVVNCAGPHAIALMHGLRCPSARPASLQQVAYFTVPQNEPTPPIFIEWGDDMIYGLPVIGQDTYKLSHHTPGPDISEDDLPFDDDLDLLELLTDAAWRLLPTLDPVPVATERCVYDNTVDSDFVIDRVGRIVVGCGTSGHGFKFGPLLGDLLADLATGAEPSFDLRRFALNRSFLRALPNL
jgi:sarcosine oxidase